jgi:2-polyprenyl-3-methyl-5-hydroxy-6-metoxy-1,4-benzoquinol methylase
MSAASPAFSAVERCWVCDHTGFERVLEVGFDLTAFAEQDPDLAAYSGARVWIRRCDRCGFGQPEALPALSGYFDRMYDQHWSEEWIVQEYESRCKDLVFRTVLADLRRWRTTTGRRLLDVGAHVGKFLAMAAADGWQVEGIELNPRTAAFAAARTGAPVHRVNLDVFAATGARFDVVTLIDVLEHIPEPVRMLRKLRTLVVPGGLVVVKVPRGPGQLGKERARAWFRSGYEIELATNLAHVNQFDAVSLERALQEADFEPVALVVAPPELGMSVGSRPRRAIDDLFRRGVHTLARVAGVRSPLAMNLQAIGRARLARPGRSGDRAGSVVEPLGQPTA